MTTGSSGLPCRLSETDKILLPLLSLSLSWPENAAERDENESRLNPKLRCAPLYLWILVATVLVPRMAVES